MTETATPRDRLSRLRDENLVSEAADAAGLDEGGRESLERLAEGLRSLPDAEASALLLRELDGLTYEQIAQLAGVTSAGARQAVYRARIGLQGDVEPPTEHCDEVRVAMSKAETSVRDRRSITAHLERCSVCAEFADQLEQRPTQLAMLFGGPGEAAPATNVPAGLAAAGVGAGAGAAAAAAAAGGGADGDGKPRPSLREQQRRRRRRLVPLVVALILVGGGTALAIALTNGGGGGKSQPTAVTPPASKPSGKSGGASGGQPKAASKPKAKARGPANSRQAKNNAAKKSAAKKSAAKSKGKRAAGGAAVASATGTGAGTARAGEPAGASSGETQSATSAGTGQASAQNGYSAGAGSIQQQMDDGGDGLPSTGLQIAVVMAAALLLLGLGLVIRGLSQPRA